jgi:hypothetical protein
MRLQLACLTYPSITDAELTPQGMLGVVPGTAVALNSIGVWQAASSSTIGM